MPATPQTTEISLVGNATPEICGNQLPSNKQVLECYIYHTRHATPILLGHEAAMCAVKKCVVFWEYAGIPIIEECHAIDKLQKLVQQYENSLEDGPSTENSSMADLKKVNFLCMLENLFDIAHQEQVSAMKNEAARILLSLHRETGRNGCLDTIIDTAIWRIPISIQEEEQEKEEREEEEERPEKLQRSMKI